MTVHFLKCFFETVPVVFCFFEDHALEIIEGDGSFFFYLIEGLDAEIESLVGVVAEADWEEGHAKLGDVFGFYIFECFLDILCHMVMIVHADFCCCVVNQ